MNRVPPHKTSRWQNWLLSGARIAVVALLLGGLGAAGAAAYWVTTLWNVLDTESLSAIENVEPKDNTLVFDREGKPLGEFYRKYHRFVEFDSIPRYLVHAVVAVEDRNFWNHPGFDLRGMARAFWVHVTRAPFSQGASTITQQVVRHYLLNRDKTWDRKIQELFLAYKLEKRLSKPRILEIYLNQLYLSNGAYGVGAAAERHFSRPLAELHVGELALIAGLFQSPSHYDPSRHPERALARQRIVLQAMREEGYLSEAEWRKAVELPVRFQPNRGAPRTAPYFLDYVQNRARSLIGELPGQGLRIHTTLDPKVQNLVETSVNETDFAALEKEPGMRVEAAVVVSDPATGEILSMVGGRDYGVSQFNRAYQSERSPGSLFKPIVYSLALEQGRLWNDLVYVSPITVKDYRPRDPRGEFLSETTLLRAFYRSMNNPTIELSRQLGLSSVLEHAARMGVETSLKEEIGTSLGGSGVSLLDMVRTYSTLANGGNRTELIAISRIEDREGRLLYQAPPPPQRSMRALSPQVAFLMTEGLRQVFLRGTGFDFKHLGKFSVGKTGTSNEGRDAWFAGFSRTRTAVVWLGTDDNRPLGKKASGATLALPLWARILTALTPPPHAPVSVPPDVELARIHPLYGNRVAQGGVQAYFPIGRSPGSDSSPLEALADQPYREWFE